MAEGEGLTGGDVVPVGVVEDDELRTMRQVSWLRRPDPAAEVLLTPSILARWLIRFRYDCKPFGLGSLYALPVEVNPG